MSLASWSSSSSVSSSRLIQEKNENPPLTGMNLGFQQLGERIIATTTSTNINTQLPVLPSMISIIGCDITIGDVQSVKQELINQKFDLKKDVNKWQKITGYNETYPMISFCRTGNLLIIKVLFLIGADCTQLSSKYGYYFPMFVAAQYGQLDTCKWLFEYGGDAKYQINKETSSGKTPLQQSYIAWKSRWDNEGKTCRWLLQNGGGQHLSSDAMSHLQIEGIEETNSNPLIIWMRESMQSHDTFILLLCGATTTMITSSPSSSSSEPNDDGTPKHKRERSLQILDGHPGIMELIGDYFGLIRGKEIRMLQVFNKLVIEYNTDESSSDDDNSEDEE